MNRTRPATGDVRVSLRVRQFWLQWGVRRLRGAGVWCVMLGMTVTAKRRRAAAIGRSGKRTRMRQRLIGVVQALPEAKAEPIGRHLSIEVRGRRFAWFLENHHGDGRLALHCRAPVGAARLLVSTDPEQFHIPKYLGKRGWVGMWLDLGGVDWTVVEAMVDDAYRMTAPRTLVRRLWENA